MANSVEIKRAEPTYIDIPLMSRHTCDGMTAPNHETECLLWQLPACIHAIVLDYAAVWRLLGWVQDLMEDLDWVELAHNPNAIDHMCDNPFDARWGYASGNPNAFYILRDELSMLICDQHLILNPNPAAIAYAIDKYAHSNTSFLSASPHAIEWIKAHPEYINWEQLSANPSDGAIELLKANPSKICWVMLSGNTHPWAIAQLDANPDKIYGYALSMNPRGLPLIKKYNLINTTAYPHIFWESLCKLDNPDVVEFVLAHPDKINWYEFSKNPAAFDYLSANRGKINWSGFSRNPRIFEAVWPEGVPELL